MKTNDLISALLLGTLFISCGSQEEDGTRPRPVTPVFTPTGTSVSTLTGTPDVGVSGNIYAGHSVSFQVSMINGYDAKCVDGETDVLWKVIGDSTKITISNAEKCRPTITTSATFDGIGTVQGNIYVADEGLVRYTGTIAKKSLPFIESLNTITGTEWTQKVTGTTLYKYARPLAGQTAKYQAAATQNPTNWLYVNGTAIYMPLRAWARQTYSTGLRGKILYEDGYDITSGTRTFEFDLKNNTSSAYIGKVKDLQETEDELEYSMDCVAQGGAGLMNSCPFQFEPIDSKTRIVKFSLKGSNIGTLTSNEAYLSGLFGVTDVFSANFVGGASKPVDFVLSMKHPHSNASDTVRITIATMNILLNIYN